MPNRRLVLHRETLTTLGSDELAMVAAGAISNPNPLCLITNPRNSCHTCGIACTANCETVDCS